MGRRVLSAVQKQLAPGGVVAEAAAAAEQKPRLLYFRGTGKCYAVRMALFAAFGEDGWIDERISQTGEPGNHPDGVSRGSGDGWRDLTVHRGALPELTLPDGSTMCQSMAIARWAARMASESGRAALYPSDATAALRVDEVMTFQEEVRRLCWLAVTAWAIAQTAINCPVEQLSTFLAALSLINDVCLQVMEKAQPTPAPDDVKAFREAFRSQSGFLGKTAAFLERRLEEHSEGPFFAGEEMTIADLCATGLVKMILDGDFTHIPPEWMRDNFPQLTAMAEATDCSPLALAYYAAYN